MQLTEYKLYWRPGSCHCWPNLLLLCHFMLNWFAIERFEHDCPTRGSRSPGRLRAAVGSFPRPIPEKVFTHTDSCVQHLTYNGRAVRPAFIIQFPATFYLWAPLQSVHMQSSFVCKRIWTGYLRCELVRHLVKKTTHDDKRAFSRACFGTFCTFFYLGVDNDNNKWWERETWGIEMQQNTLILD